ncbi:restriction endonuclease subunit S [Bacillus thuringiensis]|uniref:Restriction endonuclease subunit S n=1 Tax=Bacillus thuringiensis TaxID=1428 RepID=A0A437SGU6_BACTU|nr:restriction endonuclease subunit S [Bacillus thuringiensis]RVU62975.1 restriction endonuclease subunit S [Bacillus thuringiensis]
MKNKYTPEIRFSRFCGNWEQWKLGDVSAFINGRAYKQHELLNSGKYKVLRVGNFYTNDSWYYSNLELDEKYYAEKGDLLYTWSASFGPHIWYGDKVIYHYHIWKVDLSDKLDKQFFVQLLEYDKAKITSDKNGSTMVHITKKGMEEKRVLLPLVDEQTKIGNLFKQLDNTIALYQRELTTLKQTKQGFLQKMFPKKGESVPEVRFPGFTGDWELRRLGNHAEILTGGTPKTQIREYWEPREIPWMSSGEVNKKRLSSTDNMISTQGFENSSARWVEENSVLIALAGQGKTRGTVAINEIPLTTNQSIAAIVPKDELHYEFIFQNLENRYEELRLISSGDGNRGGLNKQLISDVEIISPSVEEQIKIGEFFKQLDGLIALHQRELDALKETKKAFLQKMFA